LRRVPQIQAASLIINTSTQLGRSLMSLELPAKGFDSISMSISFSRGWKLNAAGVGQDPFKTKLLVRSYSLRYFVILVLVRSNILYDPFKSTTSLRKQRMKGSNTPKQDPSLFGG